MAETQSTTEEKVPVTISPMTKNGKPAKVDLRNGPPVVEVLSGAGTASAVTMIDDFNFTFDVISEDVTGQSQYRATGDADLGEGDEPISVLIDYSYAIPKAANLGVSFGTPVPK